MMLAMASTVSFSTNTEKFDLIGFLVYSLATDKICKEFELKQRRKGIG